MTRVNDQPEPVKDYPDQVSRINRIRVLSGDAEGHVRQGGVTPQRHPDHQLAATSSPVTSSTGSPSITWSLALASDSALM